MAGIFLSFLVEYIGNRIVLAKTKAAASLSVAQRKGAWLSTEVVSVLVMELGILFHSLCKFFHPSTTITFTNSIISDRFDSRCSR